MITIGLFGTCGNSKWRDPFMKMYESKGIKYFNPVKGNWQAEDAQIEADHLANDDIILFPVTDETYGMGSLGEVGFSILQAIKLDASREVIVMIDQNVNIDENQMTSPELISHQELKRESIKMRALINAHLNKIKYHNVYLVDSLDNMLGASLILYTALNLKRNIITI